jgi:CDP-6-deoxy-D-xylo-4-hexulose-3-dehydrase
MTYELATSTWDEEELKAISDLVLSGQFSMGEKVHQYEKEFARYFGSTYAVMTSSGSTANLLMIAALFFTQNDRIKLKRGDEVIVPAVSWSTTYFPLQQYGLKVKFVDIDPNTLNFSLPRLEAAVSDRTRAILAVNLLGNPNDFKAINKIIGSRNIILLEDNCESMGADYGGKKAGTFGLMGTFSTYFSHHIATMEGGCIVTNDEEIYHILLCIRAHGWTRNLPDHNKVTGKKSSNFFDEAFRFVLPGYNVRPLEMSGAIGIQQLKKLPGLVQKRRENAEVFMEIFSDLPYMRLQTEIGKSSWFGFSMVLEPDAPINRSELIEIFEINGVQYRPIVTGNFVKNREVLQYFDYEVSEDVREAEYIDSYGLFIGNHHTDVATALMRIRQLFR